jgi:K+-sensing histidine kinase KdpD
MPGKALEKGRTLQTRTDYLIGIAVVSACTAISVLLRSHFAWENFAMVYLVGVTAVSVRCRRGAAMLTAILSVSAFYYFIVPIHDSFVLEDSTYIITLSAMLVVALVISTLIDKVRSQAAAVRDAEIAIETERMRNSLLSAVSHDIKTPLSAIYGAATSILEEEDRLDRAGRRELVQSIADEAERLNRVVTNLLEMTRLDAGFQVKKDWYPLEEIIGASLTRLEKPLGGRPVTIRIPPDLPMICIDDVLLEQVFINLLDNVIKYTPPGTGVEIAAAVVGEQISISIRDGGSGFPPGDEERVFEKFFRGKTNGVRGLGLGLAICRAIIQGHQGVIFGENGPNGGAVVRFQLPIGGAPPEVEALPEGSLI